MNKLILSFAFTVLGHAQYIGSPAVGTIRLGPVDSATPISVISSVNNVLAGTSNTAGAERFIDGSQSTGNAVGGPVSIRTSPLGSAGTSQNALVRALTALGNGNVGIGTSGPAEKLHIIGGARSVIQVQASTPAGEAGLVYTNSIGSVYSSMVGTAGQVLSTSVAGEFALANRAGPIVFSTDSSYSRKDLYIHTNGNALIGTTTDLGYGLHAAKSGTNGTALVYDPTATTGSTKMVLRDGAGQSTNTLEFQTSAGAVRGSISNYGTTTAQFYYFKTFNDNVGVIDGTGITVANSLGLLWSSTSSQSGSKDTGLFRNAAGVVEVNNGTAGTLRDLLTRYTQITPTAVAGLTTCNAGAAGKYGGVTDGLAPTFLATIVGGGSVKTPVYCDGTNWVAH